ncbi:hypothetical protein CC80DRAFT_444942 [Byssothecium circinans]|uniref:Microbial-type PARG catalytic domain-containing protein n=1 Tax=Byssothecium circinans TaxID=147558 RepID=A0A6A5TXS5_9PLEO|nr:hypothetical protein CC80DRAFT_444942 [Byssothecium circinans]
MSSGSISKYFNKPPTPTQNRQDKRRDTLRQTAESTLAVLPRLISQYRAFNAQASTTYNLDSTPPLDPSKCPGFKLPPSSDDAIETAEEKEGGTKGLGTRIRVINGDTLDTAASLQQDPTVGEITRPIPTSTTPHKPVLILNLASEKHAGGGWRNGAMAQEEELCYRTTLSVSLHKHYYPIPSLTCLYSPNVVLFRSSFTSNHTLTQLLPLDMPVYSVLSIAGLRSPAVTDSGKFADDGDRKALKDKIRLVLRVAATEGHTKLVLGALGCGVFRNPPAEVAECFLGVFAEKEFCGGWWEDVVFAVMDNAPEGRDGQTGKGNFGVFWRALDGKVV